MKIYILEELWWDDADGLSVKLLDAYYNEDHAQVERGLMDDQYSFEYATHSRSYRVTGVNLK